jgi:hypothetical protein
MTPVRILRHRLSFGCLALSIALGHLPAQTVAVYQTTPDLAQALQRGRPLFHGSGHSFSNGHNFCSTFSIDHDRAYILPALREALQLDPAISVMVTPWSPPGWIKTKDTMIGGQLRADDSAEHTSPAGATQTTTLPFSGLNWPAGIAVDAAGDIFVGDIDNSRLVELPNGGSQQVCLNTEDRLVGLQEAPEPCRIGVGSEYIAII